MNRRKFLRNTSLSGIGFSAIPLIPAGPVTKMPSPESSDGNGKDHPVEEADLLTLRGLMETGKLTSVALTQSYLNRIALIDRSGPTLNAVIELNPDALSIAHNLDLERKAGKLRGPLHGIPILIKDNIDTQDGMFTTAGSLALMDRRAKADAYIVKALRQAGAVLLGKTNLSEWANFRSSRSTSAWSSRGGQTRCPYILDRNPSGSSAGSGAATAASLCTVSVGTETDGSIVSPASVNGLAGIKPTVGLWSRTGIIPISATQDTAGPMARTLSDAVILLGAATGEDPGDPATAASRGHALTDYTPFLDPNGLRGKRIGIEKSHLESSPGLVALLKDAVHVLEAQGATMVEVDLMTPLKALGNAEFQVLLYEFKDGLNRYLTGSGGVVTSLKDLIAFNKAHEPRTMPYFKQETLIAAQEKGNLQTAEYTEALAKTLGFRQTITDIMSSQKLDALSGITNGAAGCIDLVNGDYDNGPSLSTPAAITGFPHITIPMGLLHGLPVGLSFYGLAWSESKLIPLAYAYEQASKKREKPLFQPDLLK